MAATNWKINHSRGKAYNLWRAVNAHSQNGVVAGLLSLLPTTAAYTLVLHNSDQITVQLPYIQELKSLMLH